MSDIPTNTISKAAIAAGEALFRRPFEFWKSVPTLDWLPPADRPEIAFAGRSNVGKSSLINALCRHKGLARTSNTPGRTQELNYFLPPEFQLYLVDMPGYGFAEAPKDKVDAWNVVVRDYLRGRPTLRRVILLVDARHGIKPPDREIFALFKEAAVTFEVVLTKIDKMNAFEAAKIEAEVAEAVAREPTSFPRVISTSSETGVGIDLLRAEIAEAAGFEI